MKINEVSSPGLEKSNVWPEGAAVQCPPSKYICHKLMVWYSVYLLVNIQMYWYSIHIGTDHATFHGDCFKN